MYAHLHSRKNLETIRTSVFHDATKISNKTSCVEDVKTIYFAQLQCRNVSNKLVKNNCPINEQVKFLFFIFDDFIDFSESVRIF